MAVTQLFTLRSWSVHSRSWSRSHLAGVCDGSSVSEQMHGIIPGASQLRCPATVAVDMPRLIREIGWPWTWLFVSYGGTSASIRLCFDSVSGVEQFACFVFREEQLPASAHEAYLDGPLPNTVQRGWWLSTLIWDAALVVGSTFFVVGILPLIVHAWRRWLGFGPGHCKCGYDLTGNVSGRCPECGRETGREQP